MKLTQKLVLILFCSLFPLSGWAQTIGVSLPDTVGVETDTLLYPVYVDSSLTGHNVLSYQIGLNFNSTYFEPVDVETGGTISDGITIVENLNTPEDVQIAGASASHLEGTGVLFYLEVRLKQPIFSQVVSFTDPSNNYFNEGSPAISTSEGSIEINELPTITVSPNSHSPLTVGETLDFNVSDGTAPYTWSLTDPSAGTIDADGLFTAQQAGSTRIVAVDSEGIRDTTDQIEVRFFKLTSPDTSIFQKQELLLPVKVSDLTGVGILSGSFELEYNNQPLNFQEIVTDGTMLEGAEVNSGSTSNGIQVAFSATEELYGEGVLTYLKFTGDDQNAGNSFSRYENIEFNEDIAGNGTEFSIDVNNLPDLSVTNSESEMLAGETQQLLASNNSGDVNWSVSDSNLAEIDTNGNLTALKGGTVRVTATDTLGAEGESNPIEIYDVLFSIPDTMAFRGDTLKAPVTLSNAAPNRGFLSFEMNLEVNSNLLEIVEIQEENSLTAGWSYSINDANPDLIKLAGAGPEDVVSDGDLLYLMIRIKEAASEGQTPDISIENGSLILDEGTPRPKAQNGSVTVRTTPAKVTLVEPSDNSLSTPVNMDFSWNAAAGATAYQFQLATTNSFNTPEVDNAGITDTELSLNDLSYGTEYFWRVRAVNASGNGDWSDVRRFETILAAPTAPTLISPDEDSTNAYNEITFEWEQIADADHYEFQLSFDESFGTVEVDSSLTGEELQITDLEFLSTYYWRVRAVNIGGESDWSNTFSFTTGPELPEKVVLADPEDGADQQLTSLDLAWHPALRADDYRVQLTTDNDFSNPVIDSTSSDTALSVTNLNHDTTYRWRVRAGNESGSTDWSEVRSFETAVELPGAVTLASPLGPELEASSTVTFKWHGESLADDYRFELSKQDDFSSLVVDSVTADTALDISVLEDGAQYWWRVRASNESGDGSYSQVATFTYTFLENLPDKITLVSPHDEATDQPTTPDLSWQSDDLADDYQIQLATSSSFTDPLLDSTLTATSITLQDLENNTTYHWRVRGRSDTSRGDWSDVWSFETAVALPGKVTLVTPVGSELGAGDTVAFEWQTESLADEYRFELSKQDDFSSLVADLVTSATTIDLSDLEEDTQYWWRVRASNKSGEGPYSDTATFTILKSLPGKVRLDSPNDGSSGLPPALELSWQSDDLAADYRVQVAENNSFSDPIVNSTRTGKTKTVENLEFGTTYYWRVRANNDTGSGDWSDVWSFETTDFTITLISPEDEATIENSSPQLQWHSVQHATEYEMQLSAASDFSTVVTGSTQTDTTFATENLSNNTQYFWRVRVLNGNIQGDWSSTRSFTVSFIVIPDDLTVSADITFGEASSSQDYRLVALPGDVSVSLDGVMNGRAGKNWQAFWDNGSDEDYLVKYDGSSTFTLEAGNGFWVTGKEPFEYSETVSMVDVDSDDNASIPLHDGWNIISNPLDIEVAWTEISSANGGSIQPAWGFNGSFGEASVFSSAKDGQAFYFLNNQGLDELLIPYAPNSEKAKKASQGNRLQLVTVVEGEKTSTSNVVFTDDEDKTDVVAPPSGFEKASLRFTASDEQQYDRAGSYARIYREQQTKGHEFGITLTATPDQPVTIAAGGWDRTMSEEIILLDTETGKKYDLSSEINLTPADKTTNFMLVMGSHGYVQEQQDEFLPKQINVKPNYPNPFNPTTTLQFSLPEQADVRVQVYDVLGRRVSTLIDEVREAGIHQVTFDASRQASGMYFAIFEIGQQRYVQKMMLIK